MRTPASPTSLVRIEEQRKIGENAVWWCAVPERDAVHFGNRWAVRNVCSGGFFVVLSRYPSKTIRIIKERVKRRS